jgi:hypothetical protein
MTPTKHKKPTTITGAYDFCCLLGLIAIVLCLFVVPKALYYNVRSCIPSV